MAGFFVHAGTADQSASPPLSPSGPISHDFQFERTIEWSQAGAGVVATIAMVANTGSFKGPHSASSLSDSASSKFLSP
jgi:hypothetical protein